MADDSILITAVVSVGAAEAVALSVGVAYDHRHGIAAWCADLPGRTVAAVRGLLVVWRADLLWLLYTPPLRGHGAHRGAGVAR